MDIKTASALYFSPTGGTKKIAERIAERACESADFLDVTVRAQELDFGPEDFVVIAIPVFGGRVPWPFAERLALVRAQGTPAAIVAVYGNRAFDDALLELRGMAEKRGFKVMAGAAFIARHSIVPEYGEGRPDAEDIRKIDEFARRIRERLDWAASAESLPTAVVPGNLEFRKYDGVPMHPSASRTKCVKCGKCAAECPVGAIPAAEPDKTDKDKCITCMRCVAVCPQFARSLGAIAQSGAKLSLRKSCATRKEPRSSCDPRPRAKSAPRYAAQSRVPGRSHFLSPRSPPRRSPSSCSRSSSGSRRRSPPRRR